MVLELYSKSFQCILIFLRIFFLNIYTYIYIYTLLYSFAHKFHWSALEQSLRFFFFALAIFNCFVLFRGVLIFSFLYYILLLRYYIYLFFYLYVKFLTLFLQFASSRKIFKYIKLFLIIIHFDFFSVVTIFLVSSAELKSSKTRFSNRPTDLLAIHT